MKAIVFQSKEKGPELTQIGMPQPGKSEVLIELHYASLNHLDLWNWEEQSLEVPVVSGSDGSGVVKAIGEDVPGFWLGKEVVINPGLHWGNDEKVFSDAYQILGSDRWGTFAEYIAVPQAYVHPKPSHLSLKESAALPMAALTAYRALFTKAELKSADTVLITGIGGGVALAALQMAIAVAAEVYVTSSSEQKIAKAVELGAKGGVDYTSEGWTSKAKKKATGFDVIIDSAGGDGFAALTEVANPAARIVLFGRTGGSINNLKPGVIFNKQLRIEGTVMGTPAEFEEMLNFVCRHRLHPILLSEYDVSELPKAIGRLKAGDNFGKVVLKLPAAYRSTEALPYSTKSNQKPQQHAIV